MSIIILQNVVGTYGPFTSALSDIYNSLMTKSNLSYLTRYSQLIAGIGALLYIFYRVWRQLANGEPVNIFPLLRPFVIGICITFFSDIILFINGILYYSISITEAMSGDNQIRFSHTCTDSGGAFGIKGAISCGIKDLFTYLLDGLIWLIRGALNIYRVLALVILAIIGPFSFGISIFDGFQNSLTTWITRYVNIFLWLPVANILNLISYQIYDILNAGGYYFWTKVAFIIMILTIYTKVPQITSWIVNPGMEDSGGAMGGGAMGNVGKIMGGAKKITGAVASKGGSLVKAGAGKLLSKGKK